MTTLNLQVAASADDARENSSNAVSITAATFSFNSGTAWMGFRFLNVTIPPLSTINSAVLQVYVDSTAGDDPDLNIYCDDVDDAAAFTTASSNISGRTPTSAVVNWTATAVGAGFVSAPSVLGPVSEVLSRAGWVSGNDLAVVLDSLSGSGFTVRFYDNLSTEGAKLDIDYTAPSSGQPTSRRFGLHKFIRPGQSPNVGIF